MSDNDGLSDMIRKPQNAGMAFALIGWTAGKNAIQASEFAPVHWTRFVGLSRIMRLGRIPGFLARDYETGGAQL
jgi:hypothetical protein